ncbi:hypothetical protein F2Q65_16760 [Thiohalocapsa marina]|uniref:Uncharacterized protein n=1 Tax=Thiohalocapsa marina TaxID=424902 RepID=A0A5M8FF21_9GAMM|nr:hypothetical protein [Thiohalocapsa marina]KAA6182974.1 hypothetical protein F2Q65_16760 [Thiohalocapsa marina]
MLSPTRPLPCRCAARHRAAALAGLLGGGLAIAPATLPAQPTDERLSELERQVSALAQRVMALENDRGATTLPPTDGIVWQVGDALGNGVLKIAYKQFDPTSGRLEMLLQITAPLQEPERWTAVGAEVPLTATLRSADGSEISQAFRLARGGSTEPGAHLHLIAEIDPARAAAARQVILGAPGN